MWSCSASYTILSDTLRVLCAIRASLWSCHQLCGLLLFVFKGVESLETWHGCAFVLHVEMLAKAPIPSLFGRLARCSANGSSSAKLWYMYRCVYVSYVVHPHICATCRQYDNNTCPPWCFYSSKSPSELLKFCSEFRVVLLLVVNMGAPNTSRRALKPLQDKENRLLCRRERQKAWHVAETAKQRQENKVKGDRARCSGLGEER